MGGGEGEKVNKTGSKKDTLQLKKLQKSYSLFKQLFV